MKRLSSFLAIVGLVLATAFASAQQPRPSYSSSSYPAQNVSSNIAVIDLPRVFKAHAEFAHFQKSYEAAFQKLQSDLERERQEVQRIYKEMQDMKAGSAQYMELESKATNNKARFQAYVTMEQKKWDLRKAEMFHKVYSQVQKVIEDIAISRGIVVVLQTNEIPSDPSKPETVQLNLEKQVVWNNKSVDITNDVIARLNPGRHPDPRVTGQPTPPRSYGR